MAKIKVKAKLEQVPICDMVGEIAIHYGFSVIKPPHITHDDVAKSKQFKDFDHYSDADEKVALTRWYIEERFDLEPQPVSIHYKKPLSGVTDKKKGSGEIYGFEIMGSSKSTSEALLLRCVLSILDELGYKDICVDINSIGDRESLNKFERELNSHFRKNSHLLGAKTKQEFKKNLYSIIKSEQNDAKEFLKTAPQTIATLGDIGRVHFKEVLESLETFGVTYKINSTVVSNKLYATHTTFEIRTLTPLTVEAEATKGELLAYGYRYNSLGKKLGAKREIPTVGATIMVKRNKDFAKKVIVKNIKKPKFYLVQLGNTAKLKALNVVEMLRKHRIPIYHSITKDKITGQLSGAEYMKATHVLIMGQKEAVEDSMVVRDILSRKQETVSLADLPKFLKEINKKK
ncbi:MAG: histidyl-tRNA synthetase [Parcubacteria group bacterium Gr01-1014_46]|nr:MAG: histidyl-tRNA synthetase [Parcubacteria group bacterium Gr01-1014_46]